MTKTPLFSIVVPIYGVEKYINQCVDSVLAQSFNDFELILVDDGSCDNCPAICDEYAKRDSRVVVIHKENGGLVSSRKAGVLTAHGDYIICLDGDDWFETDYLSCFADVIAKHSPDIICCGYYESYEERDVAQDMPAPFGYYDKEKIREIIFPYLIEDQAGRYFSPMLWAKAYRKELYMKCQLAVPNAVSIGEDHACTKPFIYHAESMYVLDKHFYHYRQNPSSMTKKPKAFIWEGPKVIGQHFENQIDMSQFDFQDQVYRNVVHNLFNVAVSQFNRDEKYSVIKQDIKINISDAYYQNAIQKCKFKGNLKGSMAQQALKFKWFFLMYIFCKIKSIVRR